MDSVHRSVLLSTFLLPEVNRRRLLVSFMVCAMLETAPCFARRQIANLRDASTDGAASIGPAADAAVDVAVVLFFLIRT